VLRLARGLIALALSYALAIAAAVAAAHAAIEEQKRRTLEALDGLGDGCSPGEPEQHAAVEELERRAHEALNGLDGSAKRRHLRGDAPSETGFNALPTARRERELDVSLPAGDTPTKLASALKPLAPIGPRAWAATPTGRPESSETYTCMFDQDVAGLLKARARARPLDCGFRRERGGGGRGARTGSDARGARYTHAWLGNLCEINTEADLEPEEPEPDMLRAWLGNLCEINTEADLEPEEPEQCAHAEPNGLEGNASVTAGTEAGIASGFSDALPGGGCEISSDKIPFGNTLKPDRLSFATLVATHVLLLEGETPTTEGETPTSLVAIAAAVAATHVLHSEGEMPTSLVAVAAAVATGGEPVEPEQHAAADKPEQRAHAEPNGLEGNASVTAGTEAGIASGFSDAPPETSTEAPPTGCPPDDAAAGALSAGAIKLESTGCPPDDAAAGALSAGAINDEETAGGITALAPAGAGAGAARELGVSTPIGPLAATVLSRRALLLPATRATPPAPAQLHSSSCAFPASSMSPGGVCEISSDEIAFAGDTLECGFASNSYDSPGRGGADGTGAKKPNYVPDKANQDQKPGGFSLATGCPPGDTAAGALSTGKLESGRGGAAAGAISAGAPKLECTGRPPGGAAAGVLSAGAIKIESERSLLGPAAASALSAGTITKLEREVV